MPWQTASLMTGLDEDGIFKVWAPKEHKDAISKHIKTVLVKRFGKVAAEYLKNIKVVGLTKTISFRRNAGISVLPGTKLYLGNQKGATLTGFFVGDTGLYAISTSHLNDLTGEEAMYETGTGLEVLGKIVSHVSEGCPFREACLIKINEDQYSNIYEYISEERAEFVTDIYRDSIHDIPSSRKEGLMNCRVGQFAEVQCKTIASIRVEGELLKDVVVWTTKADIGHEGQSGSAILWKSPSGVYEHQLVAMYIGKTELDDEVVLVSHAMHATISFFEGKIQEKLRSYNPNTTPTDWFPNILDTYNLSASVAEQVVPSNIDPDNVMNQVDPNPPNEAPDTKLHVTSTCNILNRTDKKLHIRKRKICVEKIGGIGGKNRKQAKMYKTRLSKDVICQPPKEILEQNHT